MLVVVGGDYWWLTVVVCSCSWFSVVVFAYWSLSVYALVLDCASVVWLCGQSAVHN